MRKWGNWVKYKNVCVSYTSMYDSIKSQKNQTLEFRMVGERKFGEIKHLFPWLIPSWSYIVFHGFRQAKFPDGG